MIKHDALSRAKNTVSSKKVKYLVSVAQFAESHEFAPRAVLGYDKRELFLPIPCPQVILKTSRRVYMKRGCILL